MIKTRLKGGSLSGTYLIEENNFKFVRKEVSLSINREYGFQRWYSQLKRMQRYSVLFPGIFPKILKYGHIEDLAYFDMEYFEGFITAHQFLMLENDVDKISQFTKSLINTMQIMHKVEIPSDSESIYLYIREEISQKILDCNKSLAFTNFLKYDSIDFNEEKIPSFLSQIEKYSDLFGSYTDPTETFTHGNLTLENILYLPDQNKIVFIDPYEETIIDSKLAEYSQLYQSSNSKYELYNECNISIIGSKISGNIRRYFGLDYFNELFTDFLKINCGEDQIKVIGLFEISQYIRMLPFKMEIDEDKMIFFYGLASKLLNDHIANYNH